MAADGTDKEPPTTDHLFQQRQARSTAFWVRTGVGQVVDEGVYVQYVVVGVRREVVDSAGVLRRSSSLSRGFLENFVYTAHWIKGTDCTVHCARHCATWGVVGCSRRVFERGSGFDGGGNVSIVDVTAGAVLAAMWEEYSKRIRKVHPAVALAEIFDPNYCISIRYDIRGEEDINRLQTTDSDASLDFFGLTIVPRNPSTYRWRRDEPFGNV
ncbi:hypothetical protein CVT26_004119 [Gymnopilus dilepis]|uniref:Uncharacterized protein n=1 Tax=Gymnopilus dilepis TaxID=231916 RepID=A0A409YVA3_9AGAR|nr:hypothetical protein CVT26_004119 [Gymnopilus dilepis]